MIALSAGLLAILFSIVFSENAALIAGPLFLSSVVILGMPHGVIDPLILFSPQKAKRWLGIQNRWKWVAVYLTVASVYGVIWYFFPKPSLYFFLLLTAFHWGTSEYEMRDPKKLNWLILGLSRGLLVVLGVLVLQKDGSIAVIESISNQEVMILNGRLFEVIFTGVVMIHFTTLFIFLKNERKQLFQSGLNSIVVILLLATTPALLGMGIYYMFFHGERYYAFFKGSYRSLFVVTHLVCLFFFTALYFICRTNSTVAVLCGEAIPKYFMFLAALTLPHSILVLRVQMKQWGEIARSKIA